MTRILPLMLLLACGDKDTSDSGAADDDGATDGDETTDAGTTTDDGTDSGGADSGTTEPLDLRWEIVDSGGCLDAYVWGLNTDATLVLWVRHLHGIAQTAHESKGEVIEHWDLAADNTDGPTVGVWSGTRLDEAFCQAEKGGHTIEQEWFASSGTLDIEVIPLGVPQDGEYPAQATLTFTDVVLEAPLDVPLAISELTLIVNVGYLPN
ncbi:MAG: hypothetical protein H6742_12365 [Alphaproteobacteria bacterium]|nr:hypothetical protein [Alphaproteobacteria bacterium]